MFCTICQDKIVRLLESFNHLTIQLFDHLTKINVLNVNDRLNRATHDRRNGAISKGSKTISNSPFKLAFFTSFLG
jgi:hypothetical protein